jgi:hypothetical protein
MDTVGEDAGNCPKQHCHQSNDQQQQFYQYNDDALEWYVLVTLPRQAIDRGMLYVLLTSAYRPPFLDYSRSPSLYTISLLSIEAM